MTDNKQVLGRLILREAQTRPQSTHSSRTTMPTLVLLVKLRSYSSFHCVNSCPNENQTACGKSFGAGKPIIARYNPDRKTMMGNTQVLGRLVLRDATNVTAIDQELIHHDVDFPDTFVSRMMQQQQHTGGQVLLSSKNAGEAVANAGSGGGGGGGGESAGGKPHHFYLQMLAESFAKNLPGVRRGEEQLAALAGK